MSVYNWKIEKYTKINNVSVWVVGLFSLYFFVLPKLPTRSKLLFLGGRGWISQGLSLILYTSFPK